MPTGSRWPLARKVSAIETILAEHVDWWDSPDREAADRLFEQQTKKYGYTYAHAQYATTKAAYSDRTNRILHRIRKEVSP